LFAQQRLSSVFFRKWKNKSGSGDECRDCWEFSTMAGAVQVEREAFNNPVWQPCGTGAKSYLGAAYETEKSYAKRLAFPCPIRETVGSHSVAAAPVGVCANFEGLSGRYEKCNSEKFIIKSLTFKMDGLLLCHVHMM
jgi:hypothetical protein